MARLVQTTARLAGAAVLGITLAGTAFAQNPKRFFIGPSYSGGIPEYKKLFEDPDSWTWIQNQAQFFEFHMHSWLPKPSNPGYLDDATLTDAAVMFADAEIGVAVEAGGLRDFPGSSPALWHLTGEKRAKKELSAFARWVRLGGQIDVVVLDSPFSHVLRDMGMPWDVAAHELADYLDEVKAHYPNLEFALIEPVPHYEVQGYPTWGVANYGRLSDLFDTVFPILESRGHELESFLADSPYTYNEETPGGWDKLAAVERAVQRTYGMRFGWFVNDNIGGITSEEVYQMNSRDALRKYRAAGGSPDDFNIRGWYPFPTKFVPETKAMTFTGIARQLMHDVYGNFEAANDRAETVVFEDGTLGPLTPSRGSGNVVAGALEITEDSEFVLSSILFEEPTVAVIGDMLGMTPGSSVDIALRPQNSKWTYRVSLVSHDNGTSHVELNAVDNLTLQATLMAQGSPVAADPLAREVHFAVRQRDGYLQAFVDSAGALSVLAPVLEPVEASVGATSFGPFVTRARMELVDFRDKDGVVSVTSDSEQHVVFSLVQDDLFFAFDHRLYLNAYEGQVLDFTVFESSIYPLMEVVAVRDYHLVLRSLIPVPEDALIGMVYDGDFETIRVE